MLGKPGKAVLLDCRSLEYRYLPFDASELSLIVIDTSVRRELAVSADNERRKQCEEAVQLLRQIIEQNQSADTIYALRDVTQNPLRQAVNSDYPSRTGLQASFDVCKAAGGPGKSWLN